MITKKIKGQYMNRSTFWMIKYMNGSVFSKARYMNGVGFEILARTPVPKLPLSYPRGLFIYLFFYLFFFFFLFVCLFFFFLFFFFSLRISSK